MIIKKKSCTKVLMSAFLLLIFSGCTVHGGNIRHAVVTNVELSGNNFKVLDSVTGKASVDYIVGIGPKEQNLFEQARKNMVANANLVGSSKAIINVTTDVKYTSVLLLWTRKTVYISGDVIEFTER